MNLDSIERLLEINQTFTLGLPVLIRLLHQERDAERRDGQEYSQLVDQNSRTYLPSLANYAWETANYSARCMDKAHLTEAVREMIAQRRLPILERHWLPHGSERTLR